MTLRPRLIIAAVVALIILAGCTTPSERAGTGRKRPRKGAILLAVDFQPGQKLQYKFVSSRDITIKWDASAAADPKSTSTQSESLDMTVQLAPVEVDPYGLTKLKGTCTAIRIKRTGRSGAGSSSRDAAQNLRGKSFTLAVDASGRIQDYSELDELLRQLGEKAFRADTSRGKVKEPDMIADIVAGLWFLWDAISSVENPGAGVKPGESWQSKLSVPTPMVTRQARSVTYTLDEIRQTDKGSVAVIKSTYGLAESAPKDWPVPYSGRFMMSGTFGFLGPYKILSLEGTGEELFNVDLGRTEKSTQQYTARFKAGIPPMGLKANPEITINQKLTMELAGP